MSVKAKTDETTEVEQPVSESASVDAPTVVHPEIPPDALKVAVQQLLEADPSLRAGRRNSHSDQERIQNMHDHTMSLGAYCAPGNCPADEEMPAAKPKAKPKTKATKAELDILDEVKGLGIPLDSLVNAVRDSFWDLRKEMRNAARPPGIPEYGYYDWDDDLAPCCEAVYDGFAIARINLTWYKVPFDIVEDEGVVLGERPTWIQVQQDWVEKSAKLWGFIQENKKQRELGVVKALGGHRLGNYLIAWSPGGKQRDLYGEWFEKPDEDKKTGTQGLKAIFDYMGGKLPALYQHAMDGEVKYAPVGIIDTLEIDEVGLWMETQLDLANQYTSAVETLVARKALGSSSGALPGSRKALATGEIVQWAIIEGSFTPTPAEPRLRELGVSQIKSIYEECGLEFPDTRSLGIGGEEPRSSAQDIEEESLLLLELTAKTLELTEST